MEINYIEEILDSMPLGIIISDLEGDIKFVNKQVLIMFGYESNEIKNLKIAELFKGWSIVKNLILSSEKPTPSGVGWIAQI